MLITTNLSPTYPKNTKKITKIKDGIILLCISSLFMWQPVAVLLLFASCFWWKQRANFCSILKYSVVVDLHTTQIAQGKRERERKWCMYLPPVSNQNKATCKSASFFFPSSFLGLGILDLDSPSLAIPISPVLPTTHKASKALAMEQLTWCYYNHGIPHPANQIYRNKLEREIIKSKAID